MARTETEQLVVSVEARIKDLEKNMARAARVTDRNFDKMQSRSRRATVGIERDMQRSTTRINQALATTTTRIGAFSRTIAGGLGFGALTVGLTALPTLMRNVVSELSEIGKVADKVGVTTEALQELRYGFDLAGVAANQTDTALQRFSRRIAEAASGTGELLPILQANGIALRNQDGSMRSQIDLLRDYSNLIQNAGSSQEQLLLAFRAFDTEGAALVNALRNGSTGLDELMGKAREAGAVLEDELVRGAEETDDKFAALAARMSTMAKREMVVFIDELSNLGNELRSLQSDILDAWKAFDGFWNSMTGRDPMMVGKDKLRAALMQQRVTGETPDGFSRQDMDLDAGKKGGRVGTDAIPPPTIIPKKAPTGNRGGGGGRAGSRDAAAAAAEREQKAINDLIADLEAERAQIGMTDEARRIANELRRVGESATQQERDQITALVTEIERENAALEQSRQQREEWVASIEGGLQSIESTIMAVQSGSLSAADALQKMAIQLARVVAEGAFLGQGPLSGLFGGAKGGEGAIAGGLFTLTQHLATKGETR